MQQWNGGMGTYAMSEFGFQMPVGMMAQPYLSDGMYNGGLLDHSMMAMYGMPGLPHMQPSRNQHMIYFLPHNGAPSPGPYLQDWSQGMQVPFYGNPAPMPPRESQVPVPFVGKEVVHLPSQEQQRPPSNTDTKHECWQGNTCVAHARLGCPYFHSQSSEECMAFKSGHCPHGHSCHYLHLEWVKPQICKFYMNGDCRNGSKCTFRHERIPGPMPQGAPHSFNCFENYITTVVLMEASGDIRPL